MLPGLPANVPSDDPSLDVRVQVSTYEAAVGFLDQLEPTLVPLLDRDPAAFDARLEAVMAERDFLPWGLVDSMWHQGVSRPSELIFELRRRRLGGDVSHIKAHTLVFDAEAEQWGQARELFEALRGPKDFLLFTAAEAAQFQVQPGASGIATIRLLDWLVEVL